MQKEIMLVPKDKRLIDMLVEIEKETTSVWIFLHRNTIEELISTAINYSTHQDDCFQEFAFKATNSFIETILWVELHEHKVWLEVYLIEETDISFNQPADDPDKIFFIKMAE